MYNKSDGPYGNENSTEKIPPHTEKTNHNTVIGIIVAVVILGGIIWYFNSDSQEKKDFVYGCVQESKKYDPEFGGVPYNMCGSEAVTAFCECGYEKAIEYNLDDKEWDEITDYDFVPIALECVHELNRCFNY